MTSLRFVPVLGTLVGAFLATSSLFTATLIARLRVPGTCTGESNLVKEREILTRVEGHKADCSQLCHNFVDVVATLLVGVDFNNSCSRIPSSLYLSWLLSPVEHSYLRKSMSYTKFL